MSPSKDRVVVIGGGHNGLTAAALLAKGGRDVTVVEARDALGGLAGRREFHEGHHVPGLLHDTSGVRDAVIAALGLHRHGLRRRGKPYTVCAPSEDRDPIWIKGDHIEGVETDVAKRYHEFRDFMGRACKALRGQLDQPATDPVGKLWPLLKSGLSVRRLGVGDMTELLHVAPMCVADWMRDLFADDERLAAALAVPAIEGTFFGPWSSGSAMTLLLREAVASMEIRGCGAALIDALEASAREYGASIRTGARVERIITGSGGVTGVVLEGGDTIECGLVAASCDPKQTLLKLVGEERISVRLADDMRNFRARGTTSKVHLALDGKLELADGHAVDSLRTGESLNAIEKAFDPVKYRQRATRPVLDVRVPSMADTSLCPKGHHVVSITAHYAPVDLEGGWTEEARKSFADDVVAELARYCPTVTDRIVARELLTPADLEQEYGLTGGHIHHGEHALDQLLFMRPSVECSHHATPVPGLYMCGSGTHPGGGITCAPGAMGAAVILHG